MRLRREAVELLSSIAESSGMVISATALGVHKNAGEELLAAGAIKPCGFEAVAVSQTDHDDAPVGLIWDEELHGYAYFSPSAGLVRVDEDELRRFKLDISWVLQWVARHLGFAAGSSVPNS
jgi:hypothetical protein